MLIKILGAFVIIGACSCVGYEMSRELSGRVNVLTDMIRALEKISSLISYSKTPLSEIYDEMADDESYSKTFFDAVDKALPPGEGWKEGIKALPYITKGDRRVLQTLADNLGRSDCTEQLKTLAIATESLKNALCDAKKEEDKNSRVYKSLSFFTGVGIAVLLV